VREKERRRKQQEQMAAEKRQADERKHQKLAKLDELPEEFLKQVADTWDERTDPLERSSDDAGVERREKRKAVKQLKRSEPLRTHKVFEDNIEVQVLGSSTPTVRTQQQQQQREVVGYGLLTWSGALQSKQSTAALSWASQVTTAKSRVFRREPTVNRMAKFARSGLFAASGVQKQSKTRQAKRKLAPALRRKQALLDAGLL